MIVLRTTEEYCRGPHLLIMVSEVGGRPLVQVPRALLFPLLLHLHTLPHPSGQDSTMSIGPVNKYMLL